MKEGPISSSSNFNHVPVMGKEIIQSLKELPSELTKQGLIIDTTIGGGVRQGREGPRLPPGHIRAHRARRQSRGRLLSECE